VEEAFAMFDKPGLLKLVDPVLGDHGRFYVGFDHNFAKRMAQLCGKADVIVPNLTEAAFMLGEEYKGGDYDEKYIRELLKRLAGLGCPNVVITGVCYERGKYGVAAWNAEKEEYSTCFGEEQPGSFHGTGDIFSAALFAALISGQTMLQALETAVEFTVESIRLTLQTPDHIPYGVEFERAIPLLLRKLGRI
jgi:pyridoxine kinase